MQIAQKNFYKKFLGQIGEKKTAEFLRQKGYKILEKNYKTHFGEIDLICLDNDTIVFVEVKSRTSNLCGEPSEAVNREKQKKYFIVANEYLQKTKKTDFPCRFDVVEFIDEKINHIIDAFSM